MAKNAYKPIFLQNTIMKDVSPFLGTEVEVSAEVFRKNLKLLNPFAGRESALHLTITNLGEKTLINSSLELITSEDLKLLDPGAFFGVTRRHIRIPALKQGKSVKYKLALHPSIKFSSGIVQIYLQSANWRDTHQEFKTAISVSRLQD
jgi:hypothetical protein